MPILVLRLCIEKPNVGENSWQYVKTYALQWLHVRVFIVPLIICVHRWITFLVKGSFPLATVRPSKMLGDGESAAFSKKILRYGVDRRTWEASNHLRPPTLSSRYQMTWSSSSVCAQEYPQSYFRNSQGERENFQSKALDWTQYSLCWVYWQCDENLWLIPFSVNLNPSVILKARSLVTRHSTKELKIFFSQDLTRDWSTGCPGVDCDHQKKCYGSFIVSHHIHHPRSNFNGEKWPSTSGICFHSNILIRLLGLSTMQYDLHQVAQSLWSTYWGSPRNTQIDFNRVDEVHYKLVQPWDWWNSRRLHVQFATRDLQL